MFQFTMQNEKGLPGLLNFRNSVTEESKEAEAVLRAQIQDELQNKKQCNYQPHECTQLSLQGYDYCFRHILQDKNAPYKQCAYIYPSTSKRCYMPVIKRDKKEPFFCNEHALRNHLIRTKKNARHPPQKSSENLLYSLAHHLKKSRSRSISSCTQYSDEGRSTPDDGDAKVTKSVDPFTDLDAASMNSASVNVMDACSESESDIEGITFSTVWHDTHAESSENESIDSEQDDVLKHANVYTAEEITTITKEKLTRLQTLYLDQFRHLNFLLREQRRKYLTAVKKEKETLCSIYDQVKHNPKELRSYKRLKAFNNYHRLHGEEAVCRKRLLEERQQRTEGLSNRPRMFVKCCFIEEGIRCKERALPVAKHCRKHILNDSNQVLFRACGRLNGDIKCNTPVEAIFDKNVCHLHMDLPPLRTYSQIRKDSESDFDENREDSKQNQKGIGALENRRRSLKTETRKFLNFNDTNEDLKYKIEFEDETDLSLENSVSSNIDVPTVNKEEMIMIE